MNRRRWMARARLGAALLGWAALLGAAPAKASDPDDPGAATVAAATTHDEPQRDFDTAREAMTRGAYSEAIDRLELLADRGFVHPDASFNRGVAYLARARSASPVRGDRGRAVASLQESVLLRPDDAEARDLLSQARRELERERARRGSVQHVEAPALSRALVGLLHENTWAALAVLFSAALSLGMGLRLVARRRATLPPSLALTGAIFAGVGALGLLPSAAAAAWAQYLRHTTRPAVVIVSEARLHDAEGRPRSDPPLPEGAEVHVAETRGGSWVRIEHRSREAWVRRSDIRVLARPSDTLDRGFAVR